MKNKSFQSMDNTDKGRLLEKAVSIALWNNGLLHNHNSWDNKWKYSWGDGPDHYILKLKKTIECKNLAKKTTDNISRAWLDEKLLSRGAVDISITSYKLAVDNEKHLRANGVSIFFSLGFEVSPDTFDDAVNKLTKFVGLSVNKKDGLLKNGYLLDDAAPNNSLSDYVDVCNSALFMYYFDMYMHVYAYVCDVMNAFYGCIDDKPKIYNTQIKEKNDMNKKITIGKYDNDSRSIYKIKFEMKKILKIAIRKIKLKNELTNIKQQLTDMKQLLINSKKRLCKKNKEIYSFTKFNPLLLLFRVFG